MTAGQDSKASFPFPVDDDPDLGLNPGLVIRFPQLLVEETGGDCLCSFKVAIGAVVDFEGLQDPPYNGHPFSPEPAAAPFKDREAIEAKRHRIRAYLV